MRSIWTAIGWFGLLLVATACQPPQPDTERPQISSRPEALRPQLHFTAESGWLNDPNGLVWFDGEYHPFYQHHPDSLIWGPMHWGHAVSTDLLHWQELPIALEPDPHLGTIFSGSAVVNRDNMSGLCGTEPQCLTAFYTHDGGDDGQQKQSLAVGTDRGRVWTPYAGNPIVPNPGLADFRDPKVFFHGPSDRWIMVLAAGDHVALYGSTNLVDWVHLSDFAQPAGIDAVWECPDLFPLPVDDEPGTERWVMQVDVLSGAPNDGSGAQYFVGTFDGEHFVADDDQVRWVDWGKDFYAAQSWSDLPDGRRVWLAWMSNWQYALMVPTDPWRGSMTLPREPFLQRTPDGIELHQRPIPELDTLRAETLMNVADVEFDLAVDELSSVRGVLLDIHMQVDPGAAGTVGLHVRVGENESTTIGYDVARELLFVDRSQSGLVDFSSRFAGRHEAPLSLSAKEMLDLRVIVDRSSVELFAQNGRRVLTELILPGLESDGLQLFAKGGSPGQISIEVYRLESIWLSDE